jgi:3D (Asp-Asp-Asp) domain-containing protein
MNSFKRMPLWGKIVISLILVLLLTGAVFGLVSNHRQEKTKPQVTEVETQGTDEIVNVVEEDKDVEKQEEIKIEKPTPKPVTQPKETDRISKHEQVNNVPQEPVQQEPVVNNGTNLGKFKITAYCNCKKCCGKWAGGPTASGVMPTAGRTIAVDPRVIPLGSKVIIDGYTYVAEDTGSAIKGNKIDMYFSTHSEALAWGVKYKDVQVMQ